MSILTEKHPTERGRAQARMVEFRVIGPRQRKADASRVLRRLGFIEVDESIPWREAFPEIADASLPGVCLRGARHKDGLTQVGLAQKSGIPQRHISEMENGKRPIG